MSRVLDDTRRWADQGTSVLLAATTGLDESSYDSASLLPGWTRKHLVAHVASNADALGNLVHWAATGERTPMYASPEERAAGIERGPALSAPELDAWLRSSAADLGAAMDRLTDEQWESPVVTARGRTVPATQIPWLRAREVWVHAVDLGIDVTFADLPDDLLTELCADVVAQRGSVPDVVGDLSERAAWLTGRPHLLTDAPALGPWL